MTFKERLRAALAILRRPKLTKALLSAGFSGHLVDSGWIQSFLEKKPLDQNGNPTPWHCFAAIKFLNERITPNLTVFEYGSGSSTIYYSARVSKVIAVEHEREWFELVKKKVRNNAAILFQELDRDGKYCRTAKTTGGLFDIISIDGRDRVNCAINSIDCLTEKGVILLDDTDRDEYAPAFLFLKERGFRQLTFWGLVPGYSTTKATTVFYRPGNCLDI